MDNCNYHIVIVIFVSGVFTKNSIPYSGVSNFFIFKLNIRVNTDIVISDFPKKANQYRIFLSGMQILILCKSSFIRK